MLPSIPSSPADRIGSSDDTAGPLRVTPVVVKPSFLKQTAYYPTGRSEKPPAWPERMFHNLFPGMRTRPVSSPTQHDRQPPRLLLWIDAVGGYLICLNQEIVIGQAVPGSGVDVPILGDISRRHAVLRRSGESHLIDPLADVLVDGQKLTGPRLLRDGDEIQLGVSLRFRFRKPHPYSSSVRLEPLTHHRVQPSCDAVLWIDQLCVLGSQPASHIVCRHAQNQVVLSRDGDAFRYRIDQSDAARSSSGSAHGELPTGTRISLGDLAIALEQV